MNCDQALEAISAALDGELSAKERAQLEAHLAHCPSCAALFDELAGQSRLLRQLDCQVPEGLSAEILSSLPEQVTPARRFRAGRWRRWGTVAACAVLVLWAGLALPFGQGEDAPDTADLGSSTAQYNMGDAPAPEQFSVDGAMLPDGQSGTDEASLQAGERAASAMGDVYVLTIPASKAVDETAAQVLTTAQALEDCLTGYAVSEQTELLAQYPDTYFDGAVLIAAAVASADTPTLEDIVTAENGYELVIRRQPPDNAADSGTAWLLLIEADDSVTPEDTVTVVLEEA